MDLTLDDSAQDMARRTLTVAPERFCVAGLSMGGYVALAILRQADVGRIVRKMAERVGLEAFLRQQRSIMSRPDPLSDLKYVIVPTFIGVGDGDTYHRLRYLAKRARP